jgi:tetratricopeptide (TPR) repeat protein
LKYRESQQMKYLLLQAVFLLLALFSKETAAFIPLIMIIYALISKDKIFNIRYIYFMISWLFCIGLWYFVRSYTVEGDIPSEVFGLGPLVSNLRIIPELIAKFFLPINLSTLPGFSTLSTVIGLVFIVVLIISLFSLSNLRKMPIYFGIIWFLLFLLPALLFRLPHADIYYDYFEHRSYFASIGLFIFIAEIIRANQNIENNKWFRISSISIIIILFALTTLNALNYRNATKFWMRGMKTNPERPMLYNGLAVSLQESGKNDLSEKIYLRSLKIDPNIYDTHDRLARFYYNNDQKQKALKHFYETYRLMPNTPQTIINLAVVLSELKKHEESAEILKNALNFDSNNLIYYQNIIESYKIAGNFDSAHKYLLISEQKGAKINTNRFLLDWASHLSKQNKHAEAIKMAQKVIENDPTNIEALNQLGVLHAISNDYRYALSYWEKALKLNPKFLPALQNFYKYYFRNNMYDKALVYAYLIEKAGGNIPENEMIKLKGNY